MPIGTVVLINGKTIGIIQKWSVERQQYLVEIAESGQCQYIAEKYLTH
jgi:hypothetical protein